MGRRNSISKTTHSMPSSGLMFHSGSVVSCKDESNSFFCNLTKFFNGLIMIITIIAIFYLIYHFGSIYFGKKR